MIGSEETNTEVALKKYMSGVRSSESAINSKRQSRQTEYKKKSYSNKSF